MQNRLAVGAAPQIQIDNVDGDLRLLGWDNEELLARTDNLDNLNLEQKKNRIKLSCQDNLGLNVPKGSQVRIGVVNGDASIRGLTGDLDVETIAGDLAMRDVGTVKLGTVEADFSLRRARGAVHVRSVSGDASLRELEGGLRLDSVSDDLALRGIKGSLKVNVEGDIVAHLEPQPDCEYTLVAGDDILVLLPPEADATLSIHAERIKVEWPGVEPEASPSREITLGQGAAKLKLDAGGDVVVTNRLDAVESADEYGNFAGMMFDWGGFSQELGERISRRAQEAAERAARKGERLSRRAQESAERAAYKAEKVGRRGPRGKVDVGRWIWDFNSGESVAPVPPVSDEERMTILKMLAEKKITSAQAESLLAALEGGQ